MKLKELNRSDIMKRKPAALMQMHSRYASKQVLHRRIPYVVIFTWLCGCVVVHGVGLEY